MKVKNKNKTRYGGRIVGLLALLFSFIGANKHLYKWVCPFVRPSVTPLHFRRYRRAYKHRVASIGSCYYLGVFSPDCFERCFHFLAILCFYEIGSSSYE